MLAECDKLDVAAALVIIAQLRKLKTLALPLSRSLTTLAPLAKLPLLFHPRFSDEDIHQSVKAQPEKKYLAAFVKTLG